MDAADLSDKACDLEGDDSAGGGGVLAIEGEDVAPGDGVVTVDCDVAGVVQGVGGHIDEPGSRLAMDTGVRGWMGVLTERWRGTETSGYPRSSMRRSVWFRRDS